MLLPQLPKLPQNNVALEKVLFIEQHWKLPVMKETYRNVARERPKLAAKFLIYNLFKNHLQFDTKAK